MSDNIGPDPSGWVATSGLYDPPESFSTAMESALAASKIAAHHIFRVLTLPYQYAFRATMKVGEWALSGLEGTLWLYGLSDKWRKYPRQVIYGLPSSLGGVGRLLLQVSRDHWRAMLICASLYAVTYHVEQRYRTQVVYIQRPLREYFNNYVRSPVRWALLKIPVVGSIVAAPRRRRQPVPTSSSDSSDDSSSSSSSSSGESEFESDSDLDVSDNESHNERPTLRRGSSTRSGRNSARDRRAHRSVEKAVQVIVPNTGTHSRNNSSGIVRASNTSNIAPVVVTGANGAIEQVLETPPRRQFFSPDFSQGRQQLSHPSGSDSDNSADFLDAFDSTDVISISLDDTTTHIVSVTPEGKLSDLHVRNIFGEGRYIELDINNMTSEEIIAAFKKMNMTTEQVGKELDKVYRAIGRDTVVTQDLAHDVMKVALNRWGQRESVHWRAVRLYWCLSRLQLGDQRNRDRFLQQACALAEKGIEVHATSGLLWQWVAIVRGQTEDDYPSAITSAIPAAKAYVAAMENAKLYAGDHPLTMYLEGVYDFHTSQQSYIAKRAMSSVSLPYGSLESAAGHFHRCLEAAALHPDYNTRSTQYYLGKMYQMMGDKAQAKKWLKNSLKTPPATPLMPTEAKQTKETKELLKKL